MRYCRFLALGLLCAALAPAQSLVSGAVGDSRPAPTFKSDVRLIEVHATVFDKKGNFLDGLPRERFEVLDDGAPQPIVAFEASSSDLSCALLLDTTGSMQESLPSVKNAALRLIDQLRDGDSIAIYSFSDSLSVLQDFTKDKADAKRAVLRTRAAGRTALFDGISQTIAAMSKRKGRKALVVFTDGDDNASVLHASAAVGRAKKVGIPVFAVAQGEALSQSKLFKLLKEISTATGGEVYAARRPDQIKEVFADVSTQIQHIYLIGYYAPPAAGDKWHAIKVAVKTPEAREIRAREGYYPD